MPARKATARKTTPAAPARKAAKAPAPSAKSVKASKPVKPASPAAAPASAAPAAKPAEPKKPKLVRDSFTMPKADFDLIDRLKARAIGFGRPVKKSELLRAGLQVLAKLQDDALRETLAALPQLKPGRPGKNG